jgi:hypothetical protein
VRKARRAVDQAMGDDRPEKRVIRSIWLDVVVQFSEAYNNDSVPLYLTLSGAEGRDIQLLAEQELIQLTETGAVAAVHRHRVVAVEQNTQAAAELQVRFPGLKIIDYPFQNLLRSESPFRWPNGEDEQFCCARVINLDLNQPLSATDEGGNATFPIIRWIEKLGEIHRSRRLDWCLCFTLHGEINWSLDVSSAVQDFLAENFEAEPEFGASCRDLLGDDLFEDMVATRAVDLARLSVEQQQHILMIFVPKKIAKLLCHQGWRVETQRNLRYGGDARAPMVTWVMTFTYDARAARRPLSLYRASLRLALSGAGKIEEDGSIS